MAGQRKADDTTTQPQASSQPSGRRATQDAPAAPAPQVARPEPKLPGIHVLREGSDHITQTTRTLNETKRDK